MKTDEELFVEYANIRKGLNPDGTKKPYDPNAPRTRTTKPKNLVSDLISKRLEYCGACEQYRGNRKCKLRSNGCSSCWFKKRESKCPDGKW